MMPDQWLAVLDLDKTLLPKSEVLSDYTIRVMHEFKRRGGKLAIATGRSILRSKSYADEIGAEGLITLNGSCTFFQDELIFQTPLDGEKIYKLIQELKKVEGVYIMIDYPSKIITNSPNWIIPGFRDYSDFNDFDTHEVQNIKLDLVKPHLLDDFDFDQYDVRHITYAHDPLFEVVASKGVDKKYGIFKLLEKFHLDQDHLIVFGDDYNDVGMFEIAKVSVMVENGNEDLKKTVDYITLDHNSDGVAHFMNEYFDLKVSFK